MNRATALRTLVTLALFAAVTVRASSVRAEPQGDVRPGATEGVAPELANVGIDEHLGGALPKDAIFRDTSGQMVTLGQYFDGRRPVLFVFAYHTCPMLCSLVLDGVTTSLSSVPWTVGKEFDVVSVSIDPHDTPASATKKRDQLVGAYGRGGSTKGWHFLVGDEQNIRRVTDAIGFDYHWDARQNQYAHPAAIYLLTPDAKLARYLYGIAFEPSDVRMGLLEASQGRFISTTEKLLLYCYHYDPQGKKYSLVAMSVMRLGGGLTVVLLGGLLGLMFLREKRKRKLLQTTPVESQHENIQRTAPSTPATAAAGAGVVSAVAAATLPHRHAS
jgi:protein SCO1/2